MIGQLSSWFTTSDAPSFLDPALTAAEMLVTLRDEDLRAAACADIAQTIEHLSLLVPTHEELTLPLLVVSELLIKADDSYASRIATNVQKVAAFTALNSDDRDLAISILLKGTAAELAGTDSYSTGLAKDMARAALTLADAAEQVCSAHSLYYKALDRDPSLTQEEKFDAIQRAKEEAAMTKSPLAYVAGKRSLREVFEEMGLPPLRLPSRQETTSFVSRVREISKKLH